MVMASGCFEKRVFGLRDKGGSEAGGEMTSSTNRGVTTEARTGEDVEVTD